MGLARGFFYGGAKNVVVSLWKVPDRAAGEFMNLFYQHVTRGEQFDEALRNAKLTMEHGKGASAPRYWAAFVLVRE